MGARDINPANNQSEIQICDAAIWTVTLSDNEISAYSNGISPVRIQPGSQAGHWPIWGVASPEQDYSGNNRTLTLNGNLLQVDHAPIAPPFGLDTGWMGAFTVAVVVGEGGELPLWVPAVRRLVEVRAY